MKDKLAIFDMDGTLFDTSNVNYKSYKAAIEEVCGDSELTFDEFKGKCAGRKYRDFLPEILVSVSEGDIELIHEIKKKCYSSFLHEARINQGLFELIDTLRMDYYICLATTASRSNVYEILSLFGKKEVFDYVITQEDVTVAKPNPEVFLMAMNKFGISADKTIIFEDSEVGLAAAVESKATVFKTLGFN